MGSIRVGKVGCGPRGLEHAEAIAAVEGLELPGVADREAEAAARARDRFDVECVGSTAATGSG